MSGSTSRADLGRVARMKLRSLSRDNLQVEIRFARRALRAYSTYSYSKFHMTDYI